MPKSVHALFLRRGSGAHRHALRFLLVSALSIFACLGCEPAGDLGDEEAAKANATEQEAGPPGGPPAWILQAKQQPRGLITSTPDAAPGYLLFSTFSHSATFLVDTAGQVVHTWDSDRSGSSNYLQDDGSLIRISGLDNPPNFHSGGVAGHVEQVSWDGELLWRWHYADEDKINHHDIEPLPNGNLLVIAWEQKTAREALAAGRRADLVGSKGIWSEVLLEIEPLPPDDARIVWEWRIWDHLVQDIDPEAPNFGDPRAHPHRLDLNVDADHEAIDEEELEQLKALGYVPDDADMDDIAADFLHMNSVDYNAALDQILLSIPEVDEIWIIDHSTTTAEAATSSGGRYGRGGDLLYRWGNPAAYGRGDESDIQLFYQHEATWIRDGSPGAGNVLLFNNGRDRPDPGWSTVDELTLPVAADGSYPLPENGPWGPPAPAWTFGGPDRPEFFAEFVSGARRLPNGNTFICSGPQGVYWEVTPDGETVWEYRNPFHGDSTSWTPPGTTETFPYGSFRAHKIAPDHPGLENRSLQPLEEQPATWTPHPRPAGPPGAPEEQAAANADA